MLRTSIFLTVCLLAIGARAVPVPEEVNYQGRLVVGTNLYNGITQIVFRVFDQLTNGSVLYEETQTVTVVDGLYAAPLGSMSSPTAFSSVFDDNDRFLELQIGATVLNPREPFVSVPYALRASKAERVLEDPISSLILTGSTLRIVSADMTNDVDLTGLVNDADSDPTNELQNFSSVLALGNLADMNVNLSSNSLIMKDPENGDATIGFSPSDPSFPDAGVTLRTADPAAGGSMFRVISSDGTERLRVEHAGALRTANDLVVDGSGTSTVAGVMEVGSETTGEKLTVDGKLVLREPTENPGLIISPANNGYGASPEFVIQSAELGNGTDAPFHISRNALFATSDNAYQYISDVSNPVASIEYQIDGDIAFRSAPEGTGTLTNLDTHMTVQNDGDVIIEEAMAIGATDPGNHTLLVQSALDSTSKHMLHIEPTSVAQSGELLRLETPPTANFFWFMLAVRDGDAEFRIFNDGTVHADGAFGGPADFAEMMHVSTGAETVEAGDVMVIDTEGAGSLVKSNSARSTLVAGVYSTKPGFVGSEREWDLPDPDSEDGFRSLRIPDRAKEFDEIPVAVVGIVPCKASAENGAIQPGDLLVTASLAGHAMKDVHPRVGTVVGKALEPLETGAGKIRILVTLQ